MNKISSWFLSESGKKFSFFASGALTTGVLLFTTLPHTIFVEKYQDIVRLYKKGISVPLTEKLRKRFERALELTEVDPRDKQLFKPFSVCGFDIFSAGTSYSHYGVRIGLPANFFYDDATAIDRSLISLRTEPITWDLDEAKSLLNSLILSEKAQIYAMAREIKFRETPKPLIDPLIATFTCASVYGLSNTLNTKFYLYSKPLAVRVILYTLVIAFVGANYLLTKDFSQVYYEEKIDKELKEKHPILAEGGKEFYNKLLQRNIALRKLMGKEGERNYSILGNENNLFRYNHIPLVQRKLFFEQEKV